MSTVKANNVQVGQSGTATNNFTLYQPSTPDGTVRLAVGNSGATTADVLTANSSGGVGIGTSSPDAGAKLTVAGGILTTSSFSATTGSTAGIDYLSGNLRFFAIGTSGSTKGGYQWIAKGADNSQVTSMTLDASGNLGVSTTTTAVNGGDYKNIVLGGATTNAGGYYITQNSDGSVRGQFGVDTSVIYIGSRTNHPVAFTTNNAERARITSGGNLDLQKNLGLGGTSATTSGTGITFPATQSASTDANTLDDYEEGTWTPSIGGTATYFGQTGSYTKIGRLVQLYFYIEINALGTGSTTLITGLPFTASSSAIDVSAGSTAYQSGLATSVVSLVPQITTSTNIRFGGRTAAADTATAAVAVFKAGTAIYGCINYFV